MSRYAKTVAPWAVAWIVAALLLTRTWAWQPWLVVLLVAHSKQIHAWAHTRRVPTIVAQLQRVGVFQSMRHHGIHHQRPYVSRFCTMTNYLNPVLDALRLWRGLEWLGERCGARVVRATPARGGY